MMRSPYSCLPDGKKLDIAIKEFIKTPVDPARISGRPENWGYASDPNTFDVTISESKTYSDEKPDGIETGRFTVHFGKRQYEDHTNNK